LFGKLLADAFLERHRSAGGVDEPRGDFLAAIAGGYYNHPELEGVQSPVVSLEYYDLAEFIHYMPHGTMGMFLDEQDRPQSLLNVIYGLRDKVAVREATLWDKYFTTPLIRFPWEQGGQPGSMPPRLIGVANAVRMATRYHFIGLSGHKLMKNTLQSIFQVVDSSSVAFLQKQYHVATKGNHDVVFDKLLDCILPPKLLDDTSLRDRLRKKMVRYSDFGEWLHRTPHLSRLPQEPTVQVKSIRRPMGGINRSSPGPLV
jgi:hypothetical protein